MKGKTASHGWTEAEARAAVEAYFRLIQREAEARPTNKAAVYRELNARFPRRGIKAFELKFQNISAILYELRLPYCSGLKPRFNYQRLLRLLVLDHIDRTPLPTTEPYEILLRKVQEVWRKGPIEVKKSGSGRFGLALEAALGIQQNSSKAADFMGIELKTKCDASLQTLFSRTPTRFLDGDKETMFERHSYLDAARKRKALYTSFNSDGDSLGFSLSVSASIVRVLHKGKPILEYDSEVIEEALLSKHSQTAFIALKRTKRQSKEICTIEAATYCKWPSIIRFLKLVKNGDVYLDLTMSRGAGGKVKDHGFLWRIRPSAIERLYLHTSPAHLG